MDYHHMLPIILCKPVYHILSILVQRIDTLFIFTSTFFRIDIYSVCSITWSTITTTLTNIHPFCCTNLLIISPLSFLFFSFLFLDLCSTSLASLILQTNKIDRHMVQMTSFSSMQFYFHQGTLLPNLTLYNILSQQRQD